MEYEFSPDDIPSAEAELIEDAGGNAWATYDDFRRAFTASKLRALRAAYWIILRREQPGLSLSEVSVRPRQLSWRHSEADLLELRQAYLDSTEITEDERQAQIQLIDVLLGPAAPPAEDPSQAGQAADPKAPGSNGSEPSPNEQPPAPPASASSAPSTGGRSRSTSTARPRSKTAGRSASSRKPARSSTS
jgi:hypothetical protein